MRLVIDSTGPLLSIALFGNLDVLAAAHEPCSHQHAEAIFPLIEKVRTVAGIDFNHITDIVVITGPGAFTSIRIGLSVAKGLGLGLGLKPRGIDRLTLLALKMLETNNFSAEIQAGLPLTPLVFGRGGNFFAAQYHFRQVASSGKGTSVSSSFHSAKRIDQPTAPTVPMENPGLVCSRAAQSITSTILSNWIKGVVIAEDHVDLSDLVTLDYTLPFLMAGDMGNLIETADAAGLIGECQPFYVRAPDAIAAPPLFSIIP